LRTIGIVGYEIEQNVRVDEVHSALAAFWMGMQATCDLEMARDRIGAKIRTRVHPGAA
jgi:plasmid maintenance system antidote protein VapI